MASDAEAGGFGKKETVFRLRDLGISRKGIGALRFR